jgi:hypothetical protein
LDVIYTGGVDLVKFFKSPFIQNEVKRINGSTICRLIFFNGYEGFKRDECKIVFFNLDEVRNKKGNDAAEEAKAAAEKGQSGGQQRGGQQRGGLFSKVASKLEDTIEDVRVNTPLFNYFLEEAKMIDFGSSDSEPNDAGKGYPLISKSKIDELSPPKSNYLIISKIHLESSETKGGKIRKVKNTRKITSRKLKRTKRQKH